MNNKSKILELNAERNSLLEQVHQLGETKDPQIEDELNTKIDRLAVKILGIIKQFIDELEFDFVIQQLANLGHCLNLLNDDNGHWAIVSDGTKKVVYGDDPQDDVETHFFFFVEANQWKPTIQEALIEYLIN